MGSGAPWQAIYSANMLLNAMRRRSTYLVSDIDVQDFGAETLRIGDLNGDGAPDLLFVQSIYATRAISCLTATTSLGEKLWQFGTASAENGRIYSDLPVQIYDWDNDGANEVLHVRQARYAELYEGPYLERAKRYEGDARMVVLDARTGREKNSFAIPAPADDCFLFADLTGRGRRDDLVVKDRYWNMWGVSHEGDVLWHWNGSTGHCPAIADIDGDGRDEVFVGFALIDHDGKVLFERDAGDAHQDAAYIVRGRDGEWRLFFGNGGIHCLAVDGRELWHHPLTEAQHVVAGRFRDDSQIQVAVVDRGFPRTPEGRPAFLYLYDLDGREIWRREQPKGSWSAAVVEIDWLAGAQPKALLVYNLGEGKPARLYDGEGSLIVELAFQGEGTFYATRADVWGDGREEAILFGARGACIWANAGPLALPTLYNNTLYPGM